MSNTKQEMVESLSVCPECNGELTVSQGYIVCSSCGVVLSREYVSSTYQMGTEQTMDSPDVGMYVSLGNRLHIVDGMGSYIGFHRNRFFRDIHGRLLTGTTQKKFRRLKTVYSTRARIGKDETVYRALKVLNRVSKLLMLTSQVRDRTAYLYKKLVSNPKTKASNNILLIAVCLLMAVREFKEGAPITLDEIANVFSRLGHRISMRSIARESLRLKSIVGYAPSIRRPNDYIPRVVSVMLNSTEVREKIVSRGWTINEYEKHLREAVKKIIKLVPASKRGGRNPFIFAVSAAYTADRLIAIETGRRAVLTQKLTSKATQVAEYSIRDHYSMIKKYI